jgi:hypothetical protein
MTLLLIHPPHSRACHAGRGARALARDQHQRECFLAHWFEHREAALDLSLAPIPFGIADLVASWQVAAVY